ncbi:MAG: DUF6713 family protein [Chloroflexota bacterium]
METLFFLNIALIFAHELDAIYRHEWRFFQALLGLSERMSDEAFYRVFTALHIPLLVVILWAAPSRAFQIGFDIFLMIHLGLHIGLRRHPLIDFNNPFSFALIGAAALGGALHLLLLLL